MNHKPKTKTRSDENFISILLIEFILDDFAIIQDKRFQSVLTKFNANTNTKDYKTCASMLKNLVLVSGICFRIVKES